MMEITYTDQIKDKDLEWIINKRKQFRLRDQLKLDYLIKLNPVPRHLHSIDMLH